MKHTPYTTTSKHALTVWSPTWWVPSLVWVPADLYGSRYKSIAQDIHSNEICWHIPVPPSCHSLNTCNSASPSKSCGCKTQNFRSILVQNRHDVCVTRHTFPLYQGAIQSSKTNAFMTYIFWNVCSYPNLHCRAVQVYPWLFFDCLTMKTNAPWSFNTPETTHLTTQSHNPEDLNLQQH